jgi:uncharacterized protein YbdZ (MbtH family)
MNTMASHPDLQYLCASNGDDFTSVMTINQTEKVKENSNINLNLFVISPKSHAGGEQLRMTGGNVSGESLKNNIQPRKNMPTMTDYMNLQDGGVKANPVRGRNNLKKSNWEHEDYMNADNINKYCQLTIYPHFKILPVGWDRYCENNSKTLCCKVMDIIRVPDGMKKEWYWFDKVVPIMNKKFIDMRSNTRGACRKQYMSEI